MRISDWSSDVCSSDLWVRSGARQRHASMTAGGRCGGERSALPSPRRLHRTPPATRDRRAPSASLCPLWGMQRSEEHTSELQSLMRNSYAVFCLKKKKTQEQKIDSTYLRTEV